MSSCLKRKLAEEKRRAAWTVQNQFQAVRTDGVVATGLHGHGDYPFVVIRPLPKPRKEYGRTIYNEHLPGRVTSARRFKTLDGAMKGADDGWPLAQGKAAQHAEG